MDAERWRRVEELFHATLERRPSERGAFLAIACSGDLMLRNEIESLLAQQSESLLDKPAWQQAPSLVGGGVPMLTAGTRLGPYEIEAPIGAGGMGEVYLAQDTRLERKVAIKILPAHLSSNPNLRARFEKEAKSISRLQHPNICVVHDIGSQDGVNFMVMEYVAGQTLGELIPKGILATDVAIKYAVQIAEALSHAHAAGMVHRDLKPANIMVGEDGMVKVLDFGLAKLAEPASKMDGADATVTMAKMLTNPGTIVGTVAYMSPEQARAQELDGRSDLFSFGAVLYEIVTGVAPFRGESSAVIFKAILDATPTPAARLNPKLPVDLERIIDKALEKDRDLRYQSAADMRRDLQRLTRGTEWREPPAAIQVTPPPPKRLPWIAGAAALILIVAVVAAYFFLHRHAATLTDKDTIVLADFTNSTGDPVFDGTLRQGLSAQLDQSPFLSLLSDQRVSQTLLLMGQAKDARLTEELGREVCQRTASAATIEGSIASLGNQYVLGLNAVNCRTGDLLAQEQVTANGKEQVLKALGDASTKMREKLGESLATVQKYDAPAENVTTPSLEALQAYTLGRQALVARTDNVAAIPFFQRAVSLDPNFAMAYLLLGVCYINLGEPTRAAESMRGAYELRERTSELEKLNISSYYQTLVTGNLEAARQVYELWAQTYPRDDIPQVSLSMVYAELGEDDRAVAAAQEVLRLNPAGAVRYGNLAYAYLLLNRLDEARAAVQQAQAHNVDGPFIHFRLYAVDFLQHNTAGMAREAAGLTGKLGYEDLMLYYESDTSAYHGEFAKARELTRRATDSAQRADEKEPAAGYGAEAAVRDALVGNMASAKQEAQAAIALANGRNVEAFSAIALELAGDSAQSARLASDLGKRFPEDTIVQFEYLPMIRAALELRKGDAGKAVEALAAAAPYELGRNLSLSFGLYPIYLRGEAYLAARQGAPAVAEFQKILDHPGVVINEVIGALAHLGLGRAYSLAGNNARAKTAYQDFFALWKNADTDLPILQRAKTEYAKLR